MEPKCPKCNQAYMYKKETGWKTFSICPHCGFTMELNCVLMRRS